MKKRIVRAISLILCVIMCVTMLPTEALAAAGEQAPVVINGTQSNKKMVVKSVKQGQKVTLKVKARGSGLKYQWYYRKNSRSSWKKYSGKRKATLTFKVGRVNGYQYRCRVYNSAGSAYSKIWKLKVNYIEYRALAIDEFYRDAGGTKGSGKRETYPYTADDVASAISKAKGGTGGKYTVTYKSDISMDGIRNAITEAFAGADSNDISLFYISCFGDATSTGANAGRLLTWESGGQYGYLPLATLAGWLNQVPGKIVVLIDADGSGAGILSNSASKAPVSAAVRAERFNQTAVSAFAAVDSILPGDDVAGNTGEFRNSKFYVITSSKYQESLPLQDYSDYSGSGLYSILNREVSFRAGAYETVTLGSLYENIELTVAAWHDLLVAKGIPFEQNVQIYPSASCSLELFKGD